MIFSFASTLWILYAYKLLFNHFGNLKIKTIRINMRSERILTTTHQKKCALYGMKIREFKIGHLSLASLYQETGPLYLPTLTISQTTSFWNLGHAKKNHDAIISLYDICVPKTLMLACCAVSVHAPHWTASYL